MKTPQMTGTYKISDAADIECSCGNNIEFSQGEVFKYCSKCGKKNNKMRAGTSSYTYSEVMSDALRQIIPEDQEFFYESKLVGGGPGHSVYSVMRYHSPEISAYINASKGIVKMSSESVSVSVYTNGEGKVWSNELKYSEANNIRLEFTDTEIFSMTKEEVLKILFRESKGLWSTPVSREYYEKQKKSLLSITLGDTAESYSDSRARKVRDIYVPKSMGKRAKAFYKNWKKVEKECSERRLQNNFTLLNPVRAKKQIEDSGDAVLLTIFDENRKEEGTLIMHSDIVRGQYSSLSDFDFTVDDKKMIAKIIK